MAVDYVIDRDLSLIETRLVGELEPNELVNRMTEIVRVISTHEKYLVLEDCTKLRDWYSPLDMYDAIKILSHSGLLLKIKKAVVLPIHTEAISKVQFWVTVCKNRGMNTKAFEKRQYAVDWLIGRSET